MPRRVRRAVFGLAAGALLAGTSAAAPVAADDIAEWCEVDPDVVRVGGHTYQVRYQVPDGYQSRVHELVASANPGGLIEVAGGDFPFRYEVVQIN